MICRPRGFGGPNGRGSRKERSAHGIRPERKYVRPWEAPRECSPPARCRTRDRLSPGRCGLATARSGKSHSVRLRATIAWCLDARGFEESHGAERTASNVDAFLAKDGPFVQGERSSFHATQEELQKGLGVGYDEWLVPPRTP